MPLPVRSSAAAAILVIAAAASFVACRGERPVECQRLTQCCGKAMSNDVASASLRVTCDTRDASDPVLCRRRLGEVVQAMPSLAYDEACRLAE